VQNSLGPEDNLYRIVWETVHLHRMKDYFNYDPAVFRGAGCKQLVPNEEIPERDWYEVTAISTNPWTQFNTLHRQSQATTGCIRNVRLERAVLADIVWARMPKV
jgi:hypothetical protein